MIKGTDKKYDKKEWDKPVFKDPIPLGLPDRRFAVKKPAPKPDNDPMEMIARAVAHARPHAVERKAAPMEYVSVKAAKKVAKKRYFSDKELKELADIVLWGNIDVIKSRKANCLCFNCGEKRMGGGTLCIKCFRGGVHKVLKRQMRELNWELYMDGLQKPS